ncbi:ABC transporter substrate-binding protein [Desulfobacterales bacterium HSG2]|nr:ABC transporter substrate-binding protein [Desulfobacterales bacterium HSG2]
MKRFFVSALVILCCLSVCSVAAGQDVKVGTLFDYTGALKEWGPTFQKASELAAKQMASAGFTINFVHEDTQTNPEAAEKAARKLIETDKVVAIAGSGSSGVIVPIAESVTCPADMLMISPGATSPFITDLPADRDKDFLFRTCPSDALQGVVLGKLAASLYKSASVMYVNNAYGQGLTNQFRRSFAKRGGTIYTALPHGEAVAESYKDDLRKAFARVYLTKPFRSGKSDVLCVFSYPGHAQVYVKEAMEKFNAKHFLFCDGTKSEELLKAIGPERLEGMMGTAPGRAGGEPYANFNADYKASFGNIPSTPFIANAYDATAAIGLAAYTAKARALPLTSKNIRNQLRRVANPPGVFVGPGEFEKAFDLIRKGKDINYEGASGSVDFDKNGDVVAPIEIWKFSGGKIVTYRVEYQIPEE